VLPVQHPMHRARAYTKLRRDSPQGRSLRLLPLNPSDNLVARARRTEAHAFGPSIGEPSIYPISDHGPFELSEHARVAAKRPPPRPRQSSPSYAGVVSQTPTVLYFSGQRDLRAWRGFEWVRLSCTRRLLCSLLCQPLPALLGQHQVPAASGCDEPHRRQQ